MEEEVWKPIKGYEGLYEISNQRKIKVFKRLSANGRLLREKELKFTNNSGGYDVVQLTDKNKKAKVHYVDRLMYDHFERNDE